MKKKLFTLLTLLVAVCSGAWADDVIYSMSNPTGPTDALASNATETVIATFTPNGSSAEVCNKKSSAASMVSNGLINLGGSGNSWFRAKLATGQTIQEGDVITTSDETKTFYIAPTSSKPGSVITFPFTVGANSSFIGKSDVYVWKNSNTGGGSTFSFLTITRPTGTQKPKIQQNGNNITITCATTDATIYYTTDGSEPTTSSNVYNDAFTLDNSCTVRSMAKKNDDASDIVQLDCYVTHTDALATLNYNGGTLNTDENVWTSSDSQFVLTDNSVDGDGNPRKIGYANLAGSQDGFKLNHTDYYTLQPSGDIKVTKIVVVGRSWLQGDASTIAFDGFNPASGTFFEADADRNTFIKTVEFTPSAEQDYGQAITMRPGSNQLGAYIEIYGVKRSGPAEPIDAGSVVTWDFTNLTAKSLENGKSYSFTATDGTTEMRYTAGSSDAIVAKDGNTNGYLKENGKTGSGSNKDIDNSTNIAKNRLIRLYVTGKGKLTINCGTNIGVYTVYNGNASNTAAADGEAALISSYTANEQSEEITVTNGLWIETSTKGYIYSIVWTPSETGTILTTTANMAGWRTFYDADNSYTVDDNTTVYIAAANDATKVTLAEYAPNNIPAGTPVLLKTDAAAESDGTFKMTLTKSTSVAAFSGTNELKASTAGQNLGTVYRLGFGEDGVGFYKYTTNSAAAGIVYVENVGSGNARSLMMVFDEESTGINEMQTVKNVENGKFYNLNGQQVVQPTKGMYIVNGKKYIIK